MLTKTQIPWMAQVVLDRADRFILGGKLTSLTATGVCELYRRVALDVGGFQ